MCDSERVKREATNLEHQIDELIDNIRHNDSFTQLSSNRTNRFELKEPSAYDLEEEELKERREEENLLKNLRNVQFKRTQTARVTEKIEKIEKKEPIENQTIGSAKVSEDKSTNAEVKLRKNANTNKNVRYTTMATFPYSFTEQLNNMLKENSDKMISSPSWNFSQPPSIFSSIPESKPDSNQIKRSFQKCKSSLIDSKIIPAKFVISQFKPIVNLHKRTNSPVVCRLPAPENASTSIPPLQMNTSKSTDSFLLKSVSHDQDSLTGIDTGQADKLENSTDDIFDENKQVSNDSSSGNHTRQK